MRLRNKFLLIMAVPVVLLLFQIAAIQYFLKEQQSAVEFIVSAQTVIEADFQAAEQTELLRKQVKSLPARYDSENYTIDDINPIFAVLNGLIDSIRSSNAIQSAQLPAFDLVEKRMAELEVRVGETSALINDHDANLDTLIEGAIFADRAAQDLIKALADLAVDLRNRLQQAVDREREIHERPSQAAIAIGATAICLFVAFAWFYVDRNLVHRLTSLSSSMEAVAGGNLKITLPPAVGQDEIAEMTRALTVFRDTAVEVDENNLREIANARQRLIEAIESTSEGFAFYDADDNLMLSNRRYQELLYGGRADDLKPGTPFESVVRRSVERGLIPDALADPDGYIQRRLADHRNPGPPKLQGRTDGRWILIAERKITGGGTVAVYSDVTELKQREIELEKAHKLSSDAADEIALRHKELEALSSKLAKYLSPQVYASIFSGAQKVELASQRKKLTVFFSDIEGFTETTEMMESEDLTRLLNEYLTEMSAVALQFGGTIDKYVGDAIMVFFGDPETHGVKEDATACVKMAIAMQKRMRELSQNWRDAGIVRPLACRIGINTGYCTVGNFGSDDRMDYTIVGGAVNLASRLEHEAAPGEIMISYETYAHVRDEIQCEEIGQIQIRGIAQPVATFRAIDTHENLSAQSKIIKEHLPHLRLEVDTTALSRADLDHTAELLRSTAARLSGTA